MEITPCLLAGEEKGQSSTFKAYPYILSLCWKKTSCWTKVHRALCTGANYSKSLAYLIHLIIPSALFNHANKLSPWPGVICFSFRYDPHFSLQSHYFLLCPLLLPVTSGHWPPAFFSVESGTHTLQEPLREAASEFPIINIINTFSFSNRPVVTFQVQQLWK